MARYLLVAGETLGEQTNNGVTAYFPINGHLVGFATESHAQSRARAAYTLSDMLVRVRVNDLTASTTIRSRINGANGNQSVSIAGAATGVFTDVTNSDAIASGDLVNSQIVAGATGTFIIAPFVSYTQEDPSGTTYMLTSSGSKSATRNGTFFNPVGGGTGTFATEAEAQYRLRVNTTFSNLRIFIVSNGVSEASTLRFRVGGADGNQVISIGASASGDFEDTTNTDVVSANTLINHRIAVGMGAHNDAPLVYTQMQLKGDGIDRIHMLAGVSQAIGFGTTDFFAIEGSNGFGNSTESDTQLDIRQVYNVQNMFVRIATNGLDGATIFTLREGAVDTSLSLSVGAAATGEFEDTTNVVALGSTSEINTEIDASASTVGTATINTLGLQIGEPAPPSQLPPQGIFRQVEMVAY